jgi:hypothetical protein
VKLEQLLSGDNSKRDIKAVLSWWAMATAIIVYTAYAAKGLWIEGWPMPEGVQYISIALIVGGILGAGTTLFNQKLGVQVQSPPVSEKPQPPPGESPEGPVG